MKIVELFSLSKGKSLQDFAWGNSFVTLINSYLPAGHQVGDMAITGDHLYSMLLQLPADEMIEVINTTIEIHGDEIRLAGKRDVPTPAMEAIDPIADVEEARDTGYPDAPECRPRRAGYHRQEYMRARRNEPGYTSDSRGSKVPTVALICAISLVVVCLGLAVTQSILSVKSGRQVGDGRTVSTIASIVGDVAKAFVNSSSPYSGRQYQDPYGDTQPYYDNNNQDRHYTDPRERQRPVDPDQELADRYGDRMPPGGSQEPVRPQSGDGGAPPYD